MPYVANELLDLPAHIGQRAETVQYDVIDRTGAYAGQVFPQASTASISADINGNIPRQLSGLVLSSSDYAALDPFGDKIAPHWLLSDQTRWPLGVFRFTSAPDNGQQINAGPLFDPTIILDAITDRPFGADVNTPVVETIRRVVGYLGLPANIEGSDMMIGDDQPIGWPAGGQSWATILRFLHNLCGFLPPYFDTAGVLQCRLPGPLVVGPETLTYASANSRVHPNPVNDPHILDAPNKHVVVSTGATTEDISAAATVDPALPFSIEGRGYVVPKVHRMQGVRDSSQAQTIAVRLASQTSEDFATLEFTTTPDPRHDLGEVIGFDGVAYRELTWSLDLEPGGDHTHRCNRAEAVTVET